VKRLALDIGGANLKAVWRSEQAGDARSEAFALWREPAALSDRLGTLASHAGEFDELLVTTTAELCDCFATKRQGIGHVVSACESLARGRPLHFWSTAGRFLAASEAKRDPLGVAAANWHALATWVASLHPRGNSLMIDTGSTTTDIIALVEGKVCARGLTDTARLASGELVYLGAARTPLMAMGTHITFDGVEHHIMAEHFATMADVQVLLGAMAEDETDGSTADGRPRTRSCSAARVLRMIGADLEMLDEAAALRLAQAFADRAVERLAQAITAVAGDRTMQRVVISGSGGLLARAAAVRALPGAQRVLLADGLGATCASAACAAALIAIRESSA
jgi:probable H4MPT-linked C1 transfer pathway protein